MVYRGTFWGVWLGGGKDAFPTVFLYGSISVVPLNHKVPPWGPQLGDRVAGGLNSSYIVVRGGIQGEPRALFTAGAPFRVYQGRVLIRRATV